MSLFIVSLGRQTAFNVAACFWFPCGLINGAVALTLTRDMDRLAAASRLDQRLATAAPAASLSSDGDRQPRSPDDARKQKHSKSGFQFQAIRTNTDRSEVEMGHMARSPGSGSSAVSYESPGGGKEHELYADTALV